MATDEKPSDIPETVREEVEHELRHLACRLNHDRQAEFPRPPRYYIPVLMLDGSVVIRYRLPETFSKSPLKGGEAAYVLEKKTIGRGKKRRPWWVVIRHSDGEELEEMDPYKPVEDYW